MKGEFLEFLYMLHDYKASVVDGHKRNKKPNTTLVVVSLKSLRGARCRNKRDEAKNDLQAFLQRRNPQGTECGEEESSRTALL